jgi:hypothetical protein
MGARRKKEVENPLPEHLDRLPFSQKFRSSSIFETNLGGFPFLTKLRSSSIFGKIEVDFYFGKM